jgi:hypothetical protein
LLCEGCSNVAHSQCAGLSGIPDGDWYCTRCVKEKGLFSSVQQSSENSSRKVRDTSGNEAVATPKLLNSDIEATCLPKELVNNEKQIEEINAKPENAIEQPSSVVRQSLEESPGKIHVTSGSEAVETPMPLKSDIEERSLLKEPADEEKKVEEVNRKPGNEVEQRLIEAIPSETLEHTEPAIPKKNNSLAEVLRCNAVTSANSKNVPTPEITDEEFEAKESELYELIEGLSCQHEAPKPRPKLKAQQTQDKIDDDHDDVERPRKKRGRPRKIDTNGSGRVVDGDPIEAISGAARSFLESLSITTCEAFLAAGSTHLGEELIKWRKKEGMPPLKGSGHIATISGWKTIVRNSGAVEYLSDDSDEIAEVVPESKPRSRSSIEKRAIASGKSSPLGGKKRQRSRSPSHPQLPRSVNPIKNLPEQGRVFCEYINITDAEDFLSRRTSELAEHLVKFRRKAKKCHL